MMNTNITNFRKNIFNILEQTIKHNEPVNVSTKDGNAVILSEEDYNTLMEKIRAALDEGNFEGFYRANIENLSKRI